MPTSNDHHDISAFAGDRPWESGQQDWLGLRSFAVEVARSLLAQGSTAGLVVGIEGRWGAGKSSLLNMVVDELQNQQGSAAPIILQFRPWLIGNRNALLSTLFDDLARAIAEAKYEAGDATETTILKAKEIGEKVKGFGSKLAGAGKIASLVGHIVPGIGLVGEVLGKVADAMPDDDAEGRPLSEVKDDLVKSLSDFGRQIVITVDDIDRLEPPEVMEILRLIRAVADFPNITYVLCFDIDVLAKSIAVAMGVDDGAAYLEKIVQVQISVPAPEVFQLRHWFRAELASFATASTDEQTQRLIGIIDHEGGRRLNTPRAVVRALNGIRLFWPPLQAQGADLGDLVWIQIVRATNAKYYKWIERYCNTCAVLASGKATLQSGESKKDWTDLLSIFRDDGIERSREAYFLADILPGIETWPKDRDDDPQIYQKLSETVSNDDRSRKRLKSPDHSRLYFALAQPLDAPTEADFTTIWHAMDSGFETVAALLMSLHRASSGIGVSKAVVILDRLANTYSASLNPPRSIAMLRAFADVLDDAARQMGMTEFYGPEIWNQADRLLPILLKALPQPDRAEVIVEIFEGRSLGWLTSVFRRETFAHGLHGNQRKSPDEYWFSEEELSLVCEILTSRYRKLSVEDLLNTPNPLSLLFAWRQGGDADGPNALVATAMQTDEGLIAILEGLSGRVMTSPGGEVVTLSDSNIGPFLDFEGTRQRVAEIAGSESSLAERAKALDEAFKAGSRF